MPQNGFKEKRSLNLDKRRINNKAWEKNIRKWIDYKPTSKKLLGRTDRLQK